MGLGQGAAIEAALAEAAAVEARVGQEEETAARSVAALQGQLDSLLRQQGELQDLAVQAAGNYALIAEQQRAGQRNVPETVSVFETKIRAERAAVSVASEIALLEARIAARLGTLVDGERM
jgi:adhesin transport system outer membrane protein